MEQQIGRVDRVGSWWCSQLTQAIHLGMSGDQLPRIEVWPVVFRGTYDEHNWKVLRERWDNLKAQLRGDAVWEDLSILSNEDMALLDELSRAAPYFSPTGSKRIPLNPIAKDR